MTKVGVISVSQSQLCELLGFDGKITHCEKTSTGWDLTIEDDMTQTSGTFPELTRKPQKKGGKKR